MYSRRHTQALSVKLTFTRYEKLQAELCTVQMKRYQTVATYVKRTCENSTKNFQNLLISGGSLSANIHSKNIAFSRRFCVPQKGGRWT